MLVTVFVNKEDAGVEVLGKALVSLLDRKYFVFTRDPSQYPQCPVERTMAKLREIAAHTTEDRIIVSFGCRVLPANIKEIEDLAKGKPGSLVFLKRLRGSKTWREDSNGKLVFDNERIADAGIFVLTKEDLMVSDHTNFNAFLRSLLAANRLRGVYVDFWLFGNNVDKRRK